MDSLDRRLARRAKTDLLRYLSAANHSKRDTDAVSQPKVSWVERQAIQPSLETLLCLEIRKVVFVAKNLTSGLFASRVPPVLRGVAGEGRAQNP